MPLRGKLFDTPISEWKTAFSNGEFFEEMETQNQSSSYLSSLLHIKLTILLPLDNAMQ